MAEQYELVFPVQLRLAVEAITDSGLPFPRYMRGVLSKRTIQTVHEQPGPYQGLTVNVRWVSWRFTVLGSWTDGEYRLFANVKRTYLFTLYSNHPIDNGRWEVTLESFMTRLTGKGLSKIWFAGPVLPLVKSAEMPQLK